MPEHVLLRTTYELVRTYIIRRLRSLNTRLFHDCVSLGKHGCFRVSFGWMWSVFCLQQKQEILNEVLGRFERNWSVQRFAHTRRKSHVFLMKF